MPIEEQNIIQSGNASGATHAADIPNATTPPINILYLNETSTNQGTRLTGEFGTGDVQVLQTGMQSIVPSRSGMSISGVSRVMSPNDLGPDANQVVPFAADQLGLLGFATTCTQCGRPADAPVVCANCGIYGHEPCLGTQLLHGYYFCLNCHLQVTQHFAQFQDSMNHSEAMARWNSQQASQLLAVRQRAREAAGFSEQAGMAVGAAVATVASSALSAVRGMVGGVTAAVSSGGTRRLKRSASADDLPPSNTREVPQTLAPLRHYCRKCRDAVHRAPHVYEDPQCVGFPRSVHFQPKGTHRPMLPKPTMNVPPMPVSLAPDQGAASSS